MKKQELLEVMQTAKVSVEGLRPAIVATIEGRFEDADRIFKQQMQEHPTSSYVFHDYGSFLATCRNDYHLAMPWFSKSVELEPQLALHAYQAGRCAWFCGPDHDEETRIFFQLARQCKDYADLNAFKRFVIERLFSRPSMHEIYPNWSQLCEWPEVFSAYLSDDACKCRPMRVLLPMDDSGYLSRCQTCSRFPSVYSGGLNPDGIV